ncbi:MAG: nucleotidyltransferase [Bacilli bacterium]|nr:nucleotidyltransferase [Bacilli bacterium]
MKSIGIIAEYNPFTKGHLYHLEKVKEMFPDYAIIAVISGNFTERGDVSIIDKFTKTEIALKMGIDLVIELPYGYATDSADFFSYAALKILNELQVEKIVFGSESANIDDMKIIAETQVNNKDFDNLVKINMRLGTNYPTAISNTIYELTNKKITTPNDLLGISYLKEIYINKYNIEPISIKRTSDYNSTSLNNKYPSASAIREALEKGKEIKNYVPKEVYNILKKTTLHFQDDYFSILKYKIMTTDDISIYHGIDEGIENKIKKSILKANNTDELIDQVKSKRYTYNRIKRMLNHILCEYTKDKKKEIKDINYIRVLGYNDKGKVYLNKIKKDTNIKIISNFSKAKDPLMDLEFLATITYASTLDEKEKQNLIEKEFKHHP